MSDAELPALLQLETVGDGRYRVTHPDTPPEGRDVVFGGQLLAQMIMAADARPGPDKDPKSVHALFARAGSYSQPLELVVESIQSGRTWASDTVTAWQDGRLLARALVLASIDDPDLMRHGVAGPSVAPPGEAGRTGVAAYPGAETRAADEPDRSDGVPRQRFWHRWDGSVASPAANDAILAWATNGSFIGLAMEGHRDSVDIGEAHRSISTGVIGHTIHFHERIDVGQWLLVELEATYAGRGRVHGRGSVFDESGQLVATFSQDSMARKIEGELDPRRSM